MSFSSFYTESPYKGHLSEAIDKAWETLIHSRILSLLSCAGSDQSIQGGYISHPKRRYCKQAPQSPGHVRLPDDQGGGYWGNIEVYHQLHCLNLVRQYKYQNYCRQNPNILPLSFADSGGALLEHVDTLLL